MEGDRARLHRVKIGARNARVAEVVEGPDAGEQVVLHPGEAVRDGVRVVERKIPCGG